MKMNLPSLALCWIPTLSCAPAPALAEIGQAIKPPLQIALDINNDGRMDLAVVMQDDDNPQADLAIYLGSDNEKLDLSRKPAFLKKALTTDRILALEKKGKRSLVITYGCGGCSNDFQTSLTIIYRGGDFIVAGATYVWDTRAGAGSCDINFLTGRALASTGLDVGKPIHGKFAPVKLANWSDEKRPAACGF